MMKKKGLKTDLKRAVLGCFFVVIGILGGIFANTMIAGRAYAEPVDITTPTALEQAQAETTETTETVDVTTPTAVSTATTTTSAKSGDASCKQSLGALGWLVCPATGKIAEAVDWLYEKIENILVINPVEIADGSPIYEIWKYCRGVTNVVFIIFLLVVIYSQITGMGINNYGVKKVLPKLIVAAVLVNLSFLICSLAVDVSNIIGESLRGVFTGIQESTLAANGFTTGVKFSMAEMYSSLAGGAALAVGAGVIAFETGAIWMLIPTVLGAIVAVASGLITIALRQAVVALLIMISPLAFVAYMLPNTEDLFKKWKKLLIRMLTFYPLFSLLFGASQLAGFAIIASAKDGFGLLLGVAVQIFPLFFSWSLMKMSGTFLGDINSRMRGLAAKPLAANRAWADSRRQLSKQKHLASDKAYTPSLKLMQFMSNRKVAREEEMSEHAATVRNRGLAYNAMRKYDKNGVPTREGEADYAAQAKNMEYMRIIERHKNNMNKGLGQLEAVKLGATTAQKARLNKLDIANVEASDNLKAEIARGAEIDYENARGFFNRTLNAKFAEDDRKALEAGDKEHQMHSGVLDSPDNLARYEQFKKIMEGQDDGVQTVLADAANSAQAQAQIRRNKFQSAAELTPATQNVADHIGDLVRSKNAVANIDAIIGGLRVLNMRGDTDLVAKELEHNLVGILADSGKIELGTYASQAIANYAMFDVKDNDPVLRRFGKYINMQTAALYNDDKPEKRRTRKDVSWWEYVNSEYIEHDEQGNVVYDDGGNVVTRKTRGMRELLPGTSYSRVERTAYRSQREGVRAASYEIGSDGKISSEFSLERYLNNMDSLYDSTLANIISDQFSYLSGSEQITALAKDITGVGKDGKWDWEYIFGNELKERTLEQKAEYILRSRDLVKKFLGGHVPSQIARSKTDMLQSIESQYALLDEVLRVNDEGKEVVDLARLEELEGRSFVAGDENTPGSYKNFLQEKREAVKKRFQESFKEDAVKGFAKQFMKGYQGEAKDLLIKLLDPEALYERYYPNGEGRRRSQRRDVADDDDGMPVGTDGGLGGGPTGAVYNTTRNNIEDLYDNYRGSMGQENVEDFWGRVRDIIESSDEVSSKEIFFQDIEESLPQYTNVTTLYRDIMHKLFGGF